MSSAISTSSFIYSEGCWSFRLPHAFQFDIQDLVGPDLLGIEPELMKCDNEFPLKRKELQCWELKIFSWATYGPNGAHQF